MEMEAWSGSTELHSMASGSNEAPTVIIVDRACRLTVTIDAVRNIKRSSNLKDVVIKITVEGKSRKSSQIVGKTSELGILDINQSFAFDVKNVKQSALLVQVYKKSFFGNELLGQCKDISVFKFLTEEEELKSEWYDLYLKDGGKALPGKVLMQIKAGVAKPEEKIHVFVGTWNVGNSRPDKNLSAWLATSSSCNIVAIGAQECEYSPRAPHADCSKDWIATLKSELGPQYKVVHGLSRGQMRLVVFVHTDSQKAISEVFDGSEATGVGHVVSNKGAVCVSFKFWDTSFCFVNCHLAAHEGQYQLRNENYKEIVGNVRMNNPNTDMLNQFHHVFWLGDLNYRLHTEKTEKTHPTHDTAAWDSITEQIWQKEFDKLFAMDELHREQEAKQALYAFKEGKITFPPTFKMKRGAEDVYEQKRLPAWCDRILWYSLPGCTIEQLSYMSAPSILSSDHKPVAATFALTAYALPCNNVDDSGEEDKQWHIRFKALQAKNLNVGDFGGSSDPYVVFYGPNLFQEVDTKVKFRNLNPVWNPSKDLPTIVLNTYAMERVEKEYLFVRIVDFDYTSRDDTLGYGVIPLAGVLNAFKCNGTCDFEVELSHRGCPAGTLEGSMQFTWEKNLTKRRFRLTNTFMRRTQTMRLQIKRSIVSRHVVSEKAN